MLLLALLVVLGFVSESLATTRPIIGILTQPTNGELTKYGWSYIAASYVKYMESAGARVVPIFHNAPEAELLRMFKSVNGILLPGGGSDLSSHYPLFKAGRLLVETAIKANKNGDYFPVQGHCMGFELLNIIISGNGTVLDHFDAENITLPLDFTSEYKSSRMFKNAPDEIINIFKNQPVTMNNHMYGVGDPQYAENPALPAFFNVLSHNKDREGKVFISTIEGKSVPIYGLQWHPEKNLFEWWSKEVIQHTSEAVKAAQYISDFFVSEARKNKHQFASEDEEYKSLIWNYNPIYTAKITPDFVQCYVFDK